MKVALIASECVPYAKTGGLADVMGTLPKTLLKNKIEVVTLLPKYKSIDGKKLHWKLIIKGLRIPIGNKIEPADVWLSKNTFTGTTYFIEHTSYFNRDELYRTSSGDYVDNDERFVFFNRAVLETLKSVSFQPDVIHCHDWQTGLIPAYLKTVYLLDGFYHKTVTVYTIHNIAYQGMFPKNTTFLAGFPWFDFTPDKLEYFGTLNFMKAGIVYANVINTVSPTYAQEIQSTNEYGRGMEGILRTRKQDLYGVLNGIDYLKWDPQTDVNLPARYSVKSLDGKLKCKLSLLKELNFTDEPETPLCGMVSRLDPLKGFDLLAQCIHSMMQANIRLVILGLGDKVYQDALTLISHQYPGKISLQLKFDDPLAHRIYAGVDLFLMPSKYEPCGLAQMIAMRYGTIPIVRSTGGLADTVTQFNPETGKGNGFVFDEYSPTALCTVIENAITCYKNQETWTKIIKNAITTNFNWDKAVKEYLKLYKLALAKRKV